MSPFGGELGSLLFFQKKSSFLSFSPSFWLKKFPFLELLHHSTPCLLHFTPSRSFVPLLCSTCLLPLLVCLHCQLRQTSSFFQLLRCRLWVVGLTEKLTTDNRQTENRQKLFRARKGEKSSSFKKT